MAIKCAYKPLQPLKVSEISYTVFSEVLCGIYFK